MDDFGTTAQQTPKEKPRLRGFGYAYKRGAIYWIRYSVRGKEFRESSGSERENDAFKLLKGRWQQVGRGRFIGPAQEHVTMDDLFAAFETDYQTNQRHSLITLRGRLFHLRRAFCHMNAVDVNEPKIEQYKQARLADKTRRGNKIRPATVNRELAAREKPSGWR